MGCDEKLFVTAHDFLICRLLKELQKPVDRLNKYRFNGIECYLKLILEALFNLNIEVNACRSFEIVYALYYGGWVSVRFSDRKLTDNKDYSTEYINNLNVGTANVIVTGLGAAMLPFRSIRMSITPQRTTPASAV